MLYSTKYKNSRGLKVDVHDGNENLTNRDNGELLQRENTLLDKLSAFLPSSIDTSEPIPPQKYYPPDTQELTWHIRKAPPPFEDASLEAYPMIFQEHGSAKGRWVIDLFNLTDTTDPHDQEIYDPGSDTYFNYNGRTPSRYEHPSFPINPILQIFFDVKNPTRDGSLQPRDPEHARKRALEIAGCPELTDPYRQFCNYRQHPIYQPLPDEAAAIVHKYATQTYREDRNELSREAFAHYIGRIIMDHHLVTPRARPGTARFQRYTEVWRLFESLLSEGDPRTVDFIPMMTLAILGYQPTDKFHHVTAGWDDRAQVMTFSGTPYAFWNPTVQELSVQETVRNDIPCLDFLFEGKYIRLPNLQTDRVTQLREASFKFMLNVLDGSIILEDDLKKMVIYIAKLFVEYSGIQYLVLSGNPGSAYDTVSELPEMHRKLYSRRIRNYRQNGHYWREYDDRFNPGRAEFSRVLGDVVMELLMRLGEW